jgi:hypothetical protein
MDNTDSLKTKPSSLLHSIAEHFLNDSRDFATRFDALWEDGRLMHKMGRTKSFVDLLMSVECVFKAHALLSLKDRPVEEAYLAVRRSGHDLRKLAALANYLPNRTAYENLANNLAELQVHLRYSFEAYEVFFPAWTGRNDAAVKYSATIANNPWVQSIRADVQTLIDALQPDFTGFVAEDIHQILQGMAEMRQFYDEIIKKV